MNRLTYQINDHYYFDNLDDLIDASNKLGQLEDIEERLGIDLITLFKALENGFYYTNCDNEIKFCRWCVRVSNTIVEVKPCWTRHVSELRQTGNAYCWNWDTSLYVELKDYGRTWALTKEELQ